MTRRGFVQLGIAMALLVCSVDADAGRRSLRIEFIAWDNDGKTIGSPDCPGTSAGSLLVEWNGFTFSGRDDPSYLTDTYCQTTIPCDGEEFDCFNSNAIFDDEPGLQDLVGDNPGDAITGIRYSFLDGDRFEDPAGFQWAFYSFPGNVTIVGLYGLLETPLDATSYIRQGQTVLWQGDIDGFDGEYFCFNGSTYIGTWDGEPAGTDPLVACHWIFRHGFEAPP